jgi:pilus assembly protein FimV
MPESNEISFEAPSFEAPSFEMPASPTESNPDESFNMDFSLPEESVNDPMGGNTINDLSFELSSAEPEHSDMEEISFDLPALDEEPVESANSFDLSNISLELNDAPQPESMPDLPSVEEFSAPESADVDIKLDLVAAYLDMDDKEGARELLEEVLKDGGPQQQAKAKDLLATLT